MTKSRIFLFLLLCFIAGVAARSFIFVPLILIWLGVTAGALGVVTGILRRHRSLIIYSFLFLSFLFGIFRFEQAVQVPPDLSHLYGKPIVARGLIAEEPEISFQFQRLKFKVELLEEKALARPFLTLVTLGKYPEYKIGDELEVQGILAKPVNFGDFDYTAHLAKDDIFSAISFPLVEKTREGRGSKSKLLLNRLKQKFEKNIDRALPEPHAAFLKGLTLGEREFLSQDFREKLNRAGTTHIIALSGYNITLVANFLIWLLLALTIPFRFAFWIATLGIALFVLLTGASPSVTRAGVMGILILLARREGRLYSIRNALAFTGAAMIFHNPKILRFDAAFQLSFLATVGLVYLSPYVEEKLERTIYCFSKRFGREDMLDPKFKRSKPARDKLFDFRQIFIETLSAQFAVLPLLIYLFGRLSLVSPLSNLLVIIMVPYSMALGFLTGGLGLLGEPLSQISGRLTWILLEYKIKVIEFFAALPAASISIGKWAILPLAAIYTFFLWRLWKKSKKISAS